MDDGHIRYWRNGHVTWATLFSLVRIAQRTKRPRRLHLRFELNIANECYFGITVTRGHGAMDLGDPIFSGSNSAKDYAPSALAFEI